MTKKAESAAMRELREITDNEPAPVVGIDPEGIHCPACGSAMTADMRCANKDCENYAS